jgi:hypothetical protein
MKNREILTFTSITALALIVISIQTYLLSDLALIGAITSADPEPWRSILPSWTSVMIISSLIMSLFWIAKADRSTFESSRKARTKILSWWRNLILIYIFNIVALIIYWVNQPDSVPVELFLVMALFVLPFDIAALYWLPTAMGTPKTLRYIPQFATTLRNLTGG